VAARVVYLADGDTFGAKYRAELIADGVSETRVHLLPSRQVIEDLLTAESWLAAVNTLMAEAGYAGKFVSMRDLRGKARVAKRLEVWGLRNGHKAPGKAAASAGTTAQARSRRSEPLRRLRVRRRIAP
jgi:hypothetical protein